MTAIVVRTLGVEEAAVVLVAMSFGVPLSQIAKMGQDTILVRTIPVMGRAEAAAALTRALTLALIVGLAVAGATTPVALALFAPGERMIVSFGLLAVPFTAILFVLAGALRGMRSPELAAVAESGIVAWLLTLLLLIAPPFDELGAIQLYVAAACAGAALVVGWTYARVLKALAEQSTKPHPERARGRVSTIAILTGYSVSAFLAAYLPMYALLRAGDSDATTALSIALRVGSLLTLPMAVQVSVIAPAIVRAIHASDNDKLSSMLIRSSRVGLVFAAVGVILTLLAPGIVLGIFGLGPEGTAVYAIRLLALSSLVSILLGPVQTTMLWAGFERVVFVSSAAALVGGALTLVFVGGTLGGIQAAWFSALAMLLPQFWFFALLINKGVISSDLAKLLSVRAAHNAHR